MKSLIKLASVALTFSLVGCATDQQVKSIDEQLKFAIACPVGFKPSTSYTTVLYSTDEEEKEKDAKVTTECVPEDLNKEAEMEWR